MHDHVGLGDVRVRYSAGCVCVCVCVRGIWGFNLVLYERCQYMLVTRSEKVCYSEAALVAPQT